MDGKKQLIGGLVVVAALAGAVLGLRALESRSPTAPQAQAGGGTMELPPDAPFAAHECAVRPLDERPALALSFTQPLDATSEINKHVRVLDLGPVQGQDGAEQGTQAAKAPVQAQGQAVDGRIVQGSWTLGENPRFAYFPNIQPQRRYRIEVAATLKSIDAKPVAAAKSCELTIESTPPAYYFASRGTVLPAGQNGGLPIVTINVPEVDVQFLRVLPQALPRFLEGAAVRGRVRSTTKASTAAAKAASMAAPAAGRSISTRPSPSPCTWPATRPKRRPRSAASASCRWSTSRSYSSPASTSP